MAGSECRVGGKHELTKLERATRDKEDHLTTTRCLLLVGSLFPRPLASHLFVSRILQESRSARKGRHVRGYNTHAFEGPKGRKSKRRR